MAFALRMVAGQALAAVLSAGLYLLHPWLGFAFWPSMALVLSAVTLAGRGRILENHDAMAQTMVAVAKAVDSENAYPPRPAAEVVSDIRMLLIACMQQMKMGETSARKEGGAWM